MNATFLGIALIMGLTGSLHCAGMCGPIMLVLPFQHFTKLKKIGAMLLYHTGRVLVYVAMALLLHGFKHMFHPEWQRYVSMSAGVILLLFGLASFIKLGHKPLRMPWSSWVQRQMKHVLLQPGLPTLFVLGMLNGLLPCGLVYMALTSALAANSYVSAAYFMTLFGIGTMPMLISISLMKGRLQPLFLGRLRQWVPVILCVMGVIILMRGMNLGIPYLSPKLQLQHGQVKAQCCHK